MTLGGMAAAVGLIIDDAIVMVEHIMRSPARSSRGSPRAGSARGFRVYQVPCRLIGFYNHHFCSLGFSLRCDRRFFKALSLTMAASLFISFLVAWLAVPSWRIVSSMKKMLRKRSRPFHPASPPSLRGDDAPSCFRVRGCCSSVVSCVPCNGLGELPACRLRIYAVHGRGRVCS